MRIDFTKMHGLGNDFIVFESATAVALGTQGARERRPAVAVGATSSRRIEQRHPATRGQNPAQRVPGVATSAVRVPSGATTASTLSISP